MTIQNITLKNLLGGKSTQAPEIRFPNQVEVADNVVFDPVDGAAKRPNTHKLFDIRLIKDGTQVRQHVFNDSQNNIRILNLVSKTNGDFTIYMYDEKGNTITVYHPTNVNPTPMPSSRPQLDIGQDWAAVVPAGASVPEPYTEKDFEIMTIGDIVYVLNKRVPIKMSTAKTYPYYADTLNSTTAPYVGFIWIKTSGYSNTYDLEINGKRCKIETRGSLHDKTVDARNAEKGANVNTLTTNIYNMFVNGTSPSSVLYASSTVNRVTDSNIRIDRGGNVLWIYSHNPLTITNHGNATDVAVASNTIAQISDLPPLDGFKWGNDKPYIKVAGDNARAEDDYIMRYIDGVWQESVPPNSENDINQKAIFTFRKKFDGNNKEYWEGKPFVFDRRKVGDNTTNIQPSFIGKNLNGMFTHNNRFGIISGENLIMAESGEFIKPNFWNKTTLTSLDTDPIDIAVATDEVNNIHSVVQLSKNLLAFSSKAQFVLTGDTPTNTSFYKTTTYDNNPNVKPIAHGNFVYFVDNDNNVWEMATDNITETTQAVDISEHVKGYLDIPIKQLIGDTETKTLYCRTLNNVEGIGAYVYKYHYRFTNQGLQKTQAAWGRWRFINDVLSFHKINDDLYIVGETSRGTHFDKMILTGYNKLTMLDGLISGYTYHKTDPPQLAAPDRNSWFNKGNERDHGKVVLDKNFKLVTVEDNGFGIVGKYNDGDKFYTGYPYQSTIEISPVYIKNNPQYGLSYKRMYIIYENTANFNISYDYKGRVRTKTFNNRFINDNRLDRVDFTDGTFDTVLFGDNKNTKIRIFNDSPYNFGIQSIVFSVRVTARRFG